MAVVVVVFGGEGVVVGVVLRLLLLLLLSTNVTDSNKLSLRLEVVVASLLVLLLWLDGFSLRLVFTVRDDDDDLVAGSSSSSRMLRLLPDREPPPASWIEGVKYCPRFRWLSLRLITLIF